MNRIDQALKNIANDWKERAAENKRDAWLAERGITPDSPVIMDDLFGNVMNNPNIRSLPNDFARSCLFTARNKTAPRKIFMREKLFHLANDVEVYYTGQELRSADDELIWLQLVQYYKATAFGDYVEFELSRLIKDLGWYRGGHYYTKIKESFSRMKATEIYIKNGKSYGVSGAISLIGDYEAANDETGHASRYRIRMNRGLITLFAGDTFTNFPWDTYRKLSPMARRLIDYAYSHQKPYPLSIENFLALCDSDLQSGETRHKNQAVRRVCQEVLKADLLSEAKLVDGSIVILRKK